MKRFKNLLVVAGEPSRSKDLLAEAADLANRNDAAVTLMSVVDANDSREPVTLYDGTTVDVAAAMANNRREALQTLAEAAGISPVHIHVAIGNPFVEVIKTVLDHDNDLVFVAAEADHRGQSLAGSSHVMHLLRKCPVPVWVGSRGPANSDVAVAIGPFTGADHGGLNTTLVELGSSLATIRGGTLHVIHAWRLYGESLLRRSRSGSPAKAVDELVERTYLEASMNLDRLLEHNVRTDIPLKRHLVKGEPGKAVPSVVADIEPGVLVMGTLARSGLQGVIMGNTAERVVVSVDTAILAVKPDGFETPVKA